MSAEDAINFSIGSIDVANLPREWIVKVKPITRGNVTISNRSYSVVLPNDLLDFDIGKFARRTKNCIVNTARPWRCVLHSHDMTITMAGKRAWMVSTRIMNPRIVSDRVRDMCGVMPISAKTANLTIGVNMRAPLDIYGFFRKKLRGSFVDGDGAAVDIKCMHLDEQRYPALRIHATRKTQKLALELYSSGKVNATGLRSSEDIDTVISFLNFHFSCEEVV